MSGGLGSVATLADLLDHLRSRYFGKYRGIVSEVEAATMRVRAKVPSLSEQDLGWATACVPYAGPDVGFTMLPEVGSGVWIEFEMGDLSYPIWVGCYWHAGEVPGDVTEDTKAVFTAAGSLILDNAAGSLTLEDKDGNKLVIDSDGVLLEGSKGKVVVASTVKVNDGAMEVS
jgi:phage baseplate assembly protein gpV